MVVPFIIGILPAPVRLWVQSKSLALQVNVVLRHGGFVVPFKIFPFFMSVILLSLWAVVAGGGSCFFEVEEFHTNFTLHECYSVG
jgi:hypothetical protein